MADQHNDDEQSPVPALRSGPAGPAKKAGVVCYSVLVDGALFFQAGMVQCVTDAEKRFAAAVDSCPRLAMELAVMVSVEVSVWERWRSHRPDAGRMVHDHGGVVTVWATRDDLDALVARWPNEGANHGEPASYYFERMRQSLLNAAARWDEILCGWMSEAARHVMETGQSRPLSAAAAS